MRARASAALAAVALLLAGCASPSGADGATPSPTPDVVTRPGDFGNATGASGPHLHDYWGDALSLVVVDATHPGGTEPGTGPGLAGGEDVVVRTFRPESGDVVPQGTRWVNVTVSWTDAPGDQYRDPTLWVKSAGMNATAPLGPVESGATLSFEATAADADLPHQLLSAWVFELRMSSPDPLPLRQKGAVTLRAEAVRGLPLPVFPAHPDAWEGATVLPLLAADGELTYFEDAQDHGCNGVSCPTVHVPASGAIVPYNATRVLVQLSVAGDDATPVVLAYHSALGRGFEPVEPTSDTGGVRSYEIPVGEGGDGPYATQSQWEFTVLPEPGRPVTAAAGVSYTLDVTVTRLP